MEDKLTRRLVVVKGPLYSYTSIKECVKLTISTQLPQFILDHEIAAGRGGSTNIIITQPRRVAAMGVASRVAQERMEDIDKTPGTVGYAIRGERRAGPETKVLFCTTGVILRRLGSGDPDLEGVSHVVVDEAHERGVDTDLLICLLRDLLQRNKTIKVSLRLRISQQPTNYRSCSCLPQSMVSYGQKLNQGNTDSLCRADIHRRVHPALQTAVADNQIISMAVQA